jgi:adenylate cyclase
VIAAILGLTLHSYRTSRAGALALSQELLRSLQALVAAEVSGYLDTATRAASTARDMMRHGALGGGDDAFSGYAASMLRQVPQLEAFYLANDDGDFALVQRAGGGGLKTVVIRSTATGRSVTTTHTDAAGRVLDRNAGADTTYDPRQRDWFKGALASGGNVSWSHPTLFKPTQQTVITASLSFKDEAGKTHVYAVDVALQALSGFMSTLSVGKRGRAAIVERSGQVIAAPQLATPADPAKQGANPPAADLTGVTVASLHDPALSRAFDHWRTDGFGARTITVEHERFVGIASPLPAAARDWVLLIVAPEADFAGFAVADGRQSLLFSLVVIALTLLLAGLLVRQGRRADRTARLLMRQRAVASLEGDALARLVEEPTLLHPGADAPLLSELLLDAAEARRVSLWRLSPDRRTLFCTDSFERGEDGAGHTAGLELSRAELGGFSGALDEGKPFAVTQADADERTASLHRLLMRPFGSRELVVLPVPAAAVPGGDQGDDQDGEQGGAIGAVLLEDPRHPERVRNLARAVAAIAALRDPTRRRPEEAPDAAAHEAEAEPRLPAAAARSAPGDRQVLPDPALLLPDGAAELAAPKRGGSGAAVMSIVFDPLAIGSRDPGGVSDLSAELLRAIRQSCEQANVPFLKLMGHRLLAATGWRPDGDGDGIERLADAALLVREQCLLLLARERIEPWFRIGMDFGWVQTACLPVEHAAGPDAVFNLWGEGVRVSELLADTAPDPGTIQVSERAYERLRRGFLFRPRGAFFMPEVGATRTFLLAGRR